jgi:hypothetical protein
MTPLTGGCLCGDVRFEAAANLTASAFAIASTAANITAHCFTHRQYFPRRR